MAKEPMTSHALSDCLFQHLASDFAQFNGRDYLIMIDCYTGRPSTQVMRQNTTARSLITALREYFLRTAVPDVIWSDGGPHDTFHEFATLTASSIKWQSGGCRQIHEKLIRRSTKHLVLDENKLARAFLQYRNTVGAAYYDQE